MENDVKVYIKSCKICQQYKLGKTKTQQLNITDTQVEPWTKLALDIVGPLQPTTNGFRYILSCQDNLSKYILAFPLKTETAEEISQILVKSIILIFGIPTIILTDQGTNFCSELFNRVCKLLKIEKIHNSAYRPESNGALERAHASLMGRMASICLFCV